MVGTDSVSAVSSFNCSNRLLTLGNTIVSSDSDENTNCSLCIFSRTRWRVKLTIRKGCSYYFDPVIHNSQAFGWKYTLYNVVYDVYQQITVKLNTYISAISDEMITFCQIHRRQPRPPSSQNVNRNIRCNYGEIDLSKKESRISRIIRKWIIVPVVCIVVFSSFKHSSTHGFTKRLMLE